MSRPSQMRFGTAGKLEKGKEPRFKLGDKVKLKHPMGLEGVFTVDGVWWEWGEPLYCLIRKEGKNTYMSCCAEEELIKVE